MAAKEIKLKSMFLFFYRMLQINTFQAMQHTLPNLYFEDFFYDHLVYNGQSEHSVTTTCNKEQHLTYQPCNVNMPVNKNGMVIGIILYVFKRVH